MATVDPQQLAQIQNPPSVENKTVETPIISVGQPAPDVNVVTYQIPEGQASVKMTDVELANFQRTGELPASAPVGSPSHGETMPIDVVTGTLKAPTPSVGTVITVGQVAPDKNIVQIQGEKGVEQKQMSDAEVKAAGGKTPKVSTEVWTNPIVIELQGKAFPKTTEQITTRIAGEVKVTPVVLLSQDERSFKSDPSWIIYERDAKGNPTVLLDNNGLQHFTPNSTMWGIGYKTGAIIDPVTKVAHYSPTPQPGQFSGDVGRDGQTFITVSGVNDKGEQTPFHITQTEALELSKLSGEPLFSELQNMGVFPKTYRWSEVGEGIITGEQYQQFQESLSDQIIQKQDRADFIKQLSTMPQEIQDPYKSGGYEAYNRAINDYNKQLQSTHMQLPDGQLISLQGDKSQGIAGWNDLDKKYQNIGLSKGFDPMMSAIKSDSTARMEALSQIDRTPMPNYQIGNKYWVNGVQRIRDDRIGIIVPDDVQEPLPDSGYEYNVVKFLRNNPDKANVAIAAGFDPAMVTKLNNALVETRGFWTPDNKFNAYSALVAGASQDTIKTIIGKEVDVSKPVPFNEFGKVYYDLAPIISKIDKQPIETDNQLTGIGILNYPDWYKDAFKRYDAIYGQGQAAKAYGREFVGELGVPSIYKAIEPTMGWQTVTWQDNLLTGVNLASIILPFVIPKLMPIIPKFGRVEIPLETGGTATVFRGLTVAERPIIGKGISGWTFGRNIELPEATQILKGYKPETMLETRIFVNPKQLSASGFSDPEINKLITTLKDRNLFAGIKSPYFDKDVLLQPTARLDTNDVNVMVKQIVKYRDSVDGADLLYGSATIKSQLKPELQGWRDVHDWDIQMKMSQAETEAFAKETLAELQKVGRVSDYRINPEKPTLIEKKIDGNWEHIADIHSKDITPGASEPGSRVDMTGTRSYGRLVAEPAITVDYPGVGKIDIMTLSESGVRKADTILRVRGDVFYPPERGIAQPGVPKDVADFYIILRNYKGKELADEFANLWGLNGDDLLQAGMTNPPRLQYRIVPTKTPSLSVNLPSANIIIPASLATSIPSALKNVISQPISAYNITRASQYRPLPSMDPSQMPSLLSPRSSSALTSGSVTSLRSSSAKPLEASGEVSPAISAEIIPTSAEVSTDTASKLASAGVSSEVSGIPSVPLGEPSPTPSATPVPSPTPSPVPYTSPSPTVSPSPIPSPIPSPSPSPSPVPSPVPIPSPVPTEPPPPPLGMRTLPPDKIPQSLQVSGVIEWRQGKKWVAIPPPYKNEDAQYLDYPLPGTTKFATGKGSAQKTLQVLGGIANDPDIDMGWASVAVRVKDNSLTFAGGKAAADKRWSAEKAAEIQQLQEITPATVMTKEVAITPQILSTTEVQGETPALEATKNSAKLKTPSLGTSVSGTHLLSPSEYLIPGSTPVTTSDLGVKPVQYVEQPKEPEWVTVIPKGNPPAGLKKRPMQQYSNGRLKVYAVDFGYLRDTYAHKQVNEAGTIGQDLNQGAHWLVYPRLVPKWEVWIEDTGGLFDTQGKVLHEITEINKQLEGMDYNTAHDEYANPAESYGRGHPAELNMLIQKQMEKNFELQNPRAARSKMVAEQTNEIMSENRQSDKELRDAETVEVERKPKRKIVLEAGIGNRYYLGEKLPAGNLGAMV